MAAFSLVIDDTSLVLLLLLVGALSLSIYVGRAYQPLIHPLILSRQADVSQVRQPKESAVYRNVNSPFGFDLAQSPRKDVVGIASLLSTSTDSKHPRQVYDDSKSNEQIIVDAANFASGLIKLSSAPVQQINLAVSLESDSYHGLIALISASAASPSSFNTLVIPPIETTAKPPTCLPRHISSQGCRSITALVSTIQSLSSMIELSLLEPSCLVIVPSDDQVTQADQLASQRFGSHRMRIVSFSQVLQAAASDQALGTAMSSQNNPVDPIQAFYWNATAGWISVSANSLVSGVTCHLAFFPADKIPSKDDSIFVDGAGLSAVHSPSGLTLALVALYTGAAIMTSRLSFDVDASDSTIPQLFSSFNPTLIYTSAEGASSLTRLLSCVSRKSPLAGLALRSKLHTLRHGAFNRSGIMDTLVFQKARSLSGCTNVRNVMICGRGNTVGQSVLDCLRAHLGCSVINSYLPLATTNGTALTAPVCCSHVYDLQAFAGGDFQGTPIAAHVGPPSVAIEIKLVQTNKANQYGFTIDGKKEAGYEGDAMGEIFVRGTTVAGDVEQQDWISTGDFGSFRSNGTLVVIRDASSDSDPVAIPTTDSPKIDLVRQRKVAI